MSTESQELIQRLQAQMNRAVEVFSEREGSEPSAHGCAMGGSLNDLLAHNAEHDRMHAGQIADRRYSLGLLQRTPRQRYLAEWVQQRAVLISLLLDLPDEALDAATGEGETTIRHTVENYMPFALRAENGHDLSVWERSAEGGAELQGKQEFRAVVGSAGKLGARRIIPAAAGRIAAAAAHRRTLNIGQPDSLCPRRGRDPTHSVREGVLKRGLRIQAKIGRDDGRMPARIAGKACQPFVVLRAVHPLRMQRNGSRIPRRLQPGMGNQSCRLHRSVCSLPNVIRERPGDRLTLQHTRLLDGSLSAARRCLQHPHVSTSRNAWSMIASVCAISE